MKWPSFAILPFLVNILVGTKSGKTGKKYWESRPKRGTFKQLDKKFNF